MSKVEVTADDNGKVIRQSSNPEIGYVRITQKVITYSATGWVQPKDRSALILGSMEDLKSMKFKKGQKLDGKIVIKESTEPFSKTDPDRDLKIAGTTGVICCTKDGEPIYRTSFYDALGQQEDVLIAHANGDAIRKANSESAGAETIAKDEFEEVNEEVNEEVTEEIDEDESPFIEESTEDTFEL
jgi:hypothetical protein